MSIKNIIFKAFAKRVPKVRGFTKRFYFAHPFLDAWFAWFPLNQIQYDGAAPGEIYNAASRIIECDGAESWIPEWSKEGDRVKKMAEDILQQGHLFSAANTFLRAYTYYRTAHLATDPDKHNEAMRKTYQELSYCFNRFRELSKIPMEKIEVPFKKDGKKTEKKMHGYLLKAKNTSDDKTVPTLIWLSGAESIAEDFYWWCGKEGMERGYNVFVVDNPGDTATRIYNEDLLNEGAGDDTLISQMDYLVEREDIDADNIFVYGISMGGYRAGRFAQIDNRMKAVIANAPMLDVSKVLDECRNVYKAPKDAQGWGKRMCWQYGIDYTKDLKEALSDLVDGTWGKFVTEPEKIKVPFLVMAGENELGGEGIRQAKEFYNRLGSNIKAKKILTTGECGQAHCQLDNFPLARQVMFDWLEDIRK
ncbi:alpha/beta hydrolase family protein [Candidatus Uabimicrobium amorphum]|uniref:Dipeptidyl aminopeptidase n=1 Tax=Uabimicrobium amorphum TaxID=2596890 RepID=A0A5S9F5S3_UABAM|nr:alpha/beta fold hydrolase [Candidatus Uabimicrobium amorphum]BBM87155.1 dipeptidyl aminopeptidase [Candidatus Uabimicrobium amorphum]